MGKVNIMDCANKKAILQDSLKKSGRVLLAFSGGVDSSFLLAMLLAAKVDTLAVTAISPTMPSWDRESVQAVIDKLQAPHRLIESGEMEDENFVSNPPDRCFYCKNDLFGRLRLLADQEGFTVVMDGSTADDLQDYRPGTGARDKHGVISPLQEAGFSKQEVRQLSREMGLPTWNRPASPCLSSRISYGDPIELASLQMIEAAESWLRVKGFSQLRVRKQDTTARIEIPEEAIADFLAKELRSESVDYLKSLGFKFVTLDLEGFASGKLNRVLEK